MPDINGTFQGDRPTITFEVAIGDERLGKLALLLDTGAAHTLIVQSAQNVPVSFVASYERWQEVIFFGVGTMRVRRAPSGSLEVRSNDGQRIVIPVEPIHVLLYDVDDSGFAPLSIPPSLIGFQHAAFGLSQLLVDNANQRVALAYQEPFTPTRLE